jgi:hypothetical protein
MAEKLHTIAIMAAILSAGAWAGAGPESHRECARYATDLYEAVERELSKRRVTPQK